MRAPLQSVLDPGGPDAQLLSQLSWVLIIGASAIFLAVMTLLFLALRRSRRDGPASSARLERRWLLIAGAGVPAAILLALLGFSIWRTGQLTHPSSLAPLRITVTAHMWWWEIRYYDASTGREAVLANELHVPAGVPVYLALTSRDVIHAFWLPSLGGKVDMVPGRVHGLTVRADRPGVYRGQCAEYCGAQHARMALHLTVQQPQDFTAWLARQGSPVVPGPSVQLARGRQAFAAARCAACHVVRGLDEQPAQDAPVAPDLTHIGSRQTIAAGTLPMHKGTLAAWIADSQAVKPGARMPSASIDAASVNDIAAWLESLK